jgi:hypothetical protein
VNTIWRGVISAPNNAQTQIKNAGFRIADKYKNRVEPYCSDFVVFGSDEALKNIDQFWGDWIWTLEEYTL